MANAFKQIGNRFQPNYGAFWGNQNWNNNKRSPQRDPNAMDVDAIAVNVLTPEERSDLMRRGACFHCHQIGHISQNCPKKRGNNNYNRNDNYGNQNKCANSNRNNKQLARRNGLRKKHSHSSEAWNRRIGRIRGPNHHNKDSKEPLKEPLLRYRIF